MILEKQKEILVKKGAFERKVFFTYEPIFEKEDYNKIQYETKN